MVEITKPLADLTGENKFNRHQYSVSEATSIFQQTCPTFKKNPFVEEALALLSRRYKQYFMGEIYPIALFLAPKYRDFTVSRHYETSWFIRQIVTLAIKWKFSKSDCTLIAHVISTYLECNLTESQHEMSLRIFWQLTIKYSKPTRTLVGSIFSLKGHAAPMETLFSSLSYSKPEIRNKMDTQNLKIIGTVRKHLKKVEPTKGWGKRSRDETKEVNTNVKSNEMLSNFIREEDDVEEFDFLEAFEKDIFEDDDVDAIFEEDDFDDLSDVEHVHSCSTYFIDGLFDMNTFEAAGVDVNNSNSTQDIQIEDDEEDIFTVDDILV